MPTGPSAVGEAPDPPDGGRAPLSAAERASALSTGRVPVDRAAALKAGPVPVPRRFVLWIIVGFAVLGLGGIAAERLIGNAGVGALISTPVTTLAGTGPAPAASPTDPVQPGVPAIGASPSAVIGLTRLAARRAPPLDLLAPGGADWTFSGAKGKVVVLTFFNAECDDICPVLSQEITGAEQLLGSRRTGVDFVVVNSDPLETSLTPTPPALTQTGLESVPNVTFLNGPIADLSRVWKSYGVTVAVDNSTRVVTHNDAMYFVSPGGTLRFSASPFANEDTLGVYALQPSVIHSFAEGVAETAGHLERGTS
jgi:cytochrome oxidase Cu insertion factor (SCO1/SenC/PrrC family)